MKMDIGTAFSRRSLALGFVAALAPSVVPARARHRAGEHSAEKFLGSIYQHYLGKSSAAPGLLLTDAQSVRSYFTTGLAEMSHCAWPMNGSLLSTGDSPYAGAVIAQ
jgi:hypothetical protein